MDNKIQWTSDPIQKTTPFLDLNIDQSTGKIKTYHKSTSGFACYVPWSSSHPYHMKANIAFSLYFRAVRINSDENDLISELNRIDLSLLALSYPIRVLSKQRSRALLHMKNQDHSISINCLNKDVHKTIYFTTTRNSVSTSPEFNKRFQAALRLLSFSPYFQKEEVLIKRSFRQPPNKNMRLIWSSLKHSSSNPIPCRQQGGCKVCPILYTDKVWESNDGIKLSVARATCCTQFLVYIMVEKLTNIVLYVGQTKQKLNRRFSTNKAKNSWLKNDNFWIVPFKAPEETVKRIEMEQIFIQTLKPTKNKQRDYFWWSAKSNYQNDLTKPL